MGAWGADTFENDTACDWIGDLLATGDLSSIDDALAAVIDRDDYLDVDDGSIALAAADVVARLRGKFGQRDAYTEELDAWILEVAQPPSAEQCALAVRAIDRVTTRPSELVSLWEGNAAWAAAVAALRARLV